MEKSFKLFKKDLQKMNRQKLEGGHTRDFDEALEFVRTEMTNRLKNELVNTDENKEAELKTKEYLRNKKSEYKEIIEDIVYSNNIYVRGYEDDKISDFINEMIEEFCGYSILSNAFEDIDVSDIFVISWDNIYVEKKGINHKYERTFRNKKHYKDTLERFLRINEKQINIGENKIVDFEIYGDRGCATSPAVSPKDFTLTIRKHKEDHITLKQILEWNVLTAEMSEFLCMAILGECNLICAGITGSGKTTTIRAFIDEVVTKANKRMFVCEDTQELFPKNEHTVELVSFKHEDKKLAVTLFQLILTALRIKPKYIVVGEVRGEEAQAAVEAMETGHSTLFTMHGANVWNIMNRLTTKYITAMPALGIEVVERIIGSAVDFVFIQENIPDIGRKITSISEISYDFDKRTVAVNPIFKFDYKTKSFSKVGNISLDKAEKMMSRGIPYEKIEKWIEVDKKV